MSRIITLTDQQVVDTANALARQFYSRKGYRVPAGYRFDKATHPHEVECWDNAVLAFAVLRQTDVLDALSNIEDGSDV